jgi:hypothetical protein
VSAAHETLNNVLVFALDELGTGSIVQREPSHNSASGATFPLQMSLLQDLPTATQSSAEKHDTAESEPNRRRLGFGTGSRTHRVPTLRIASGTTRSRKKLEPTATQVAAVGQDTPDSFTTSRLRIPTHVRARRPDQVVASGNTPPDTPTAVHATDPVHESAANVDRDRLSEPSGCAVQLPPAAAALGEGSGTACDGPADAVASAAVMSPTTAGTRTARHRAAEWGDRPAFCISNLGAEHHDPLVTVSGSQVRRRPGARTTRSWRGRQRASRAILQAASEISTSAKVLRLWILGTFIDPAGPRFSAKR